MANFVNVLKVNTRVEISLVTSPNDYYDSRIQHVSRDAIGITLPSKRGRPITIAKGSKINVSVLTEEARYGFQTSVTGVITDQIRLIKLAMPQRVDQLQMRQFFRVPAYIRINIHLGTLEKLQNDEDRGRQPNWHLAFIEDISGGGCKINSSIELFQRDNIVVDFEDTPLEIARVQAKVVRVISNEKHECYASIEFQEIDENDRDKIVRFIYKRQLELKSLQNKDI